MNPLSIFGLSGIKLYALAAIGLLILGLVGTVAYQREVHKADVAQLALDKRNAQLLTDALKQSEADKALLARKAQELDSAIQERDKRLKALNDAKRNLADELDRLRKTLPQPDQDCFARPLPSGILDLLRDRSGGGNAQRSDSDPGGTSQPVPEV